MLALDGYAEGGGQSGQSIPAGGRQDDGGQVVGVERQVVLEEATPAEERQVEGDVVADDGRVADESGQLSTGSRVSRGALRSMSSVMPVRSTMNGGRGRPGWTSVLHSPSTRLPSKRTAPISITASASGSRPVVSRSSATIACIRRGIGIVPSATESAFPREGYTAGKPAQPSAISRQLLGAGLSGIFRLPLAFVGRGCDAEPFAFAQDRLRRSAAGSALARRRSWLLPPQAHPSRPSRPGGPGLPVRTGCTGAVGRGGEPRPSRRGTKRRTETGEWCSSESKSELRGCEWRLTPATSWSWCSAPRRTLRRSGCSTSGMSAAFTTTSTTARGTRTTPRI